VTLRFTASIGLPPHSPGGFDHGDVHLSTGRVFVAHTAADAIEVIDGEEARHVATVPGCPQASGVLCAQEEALVFAAARGAGKVLLLNAASGSVLGEIGVGPRPNGLAWDPARRRVLVADVQDLRARLVDPRACRIDTEVRLPGRPRWCAYERTGDQFLVNIREPACVVCLDAGDGAERGRWPVSAAGPHGLDLDLSRGRAYVACDDGVVVALDLATGRECATEVIAGEPDVIWHNETYRRLYVAIGRPGVIDVIDTDAMRRIAQIGTEQGAHTTAFDRVRQRLYVLLPQSCRAAVYEDAEQERTREPLTARQRQASRDPQ
jgi:DNA-binding beta-propeller fold protein YncE